MTAVLTEVDESTIKVDGSLEIESISETMLEGQSWLETTPATELKVDLAGVTDVDSASLALLLAWIRNCTRLEKRIYFANMPTKMRDIARVSGLDSVIYVD